MADTEKFLKYPVSSFLEKCVSRDEKDAIRGVLSLNKTEQENQIFFSVFDKVKEDNLDAISWLAELFHVSAVTSDLDKTAPRQYMHMLIEAVRYAEYVCSKNNEDGIYLLSKILFGPPRVVGGTPAINNAVQLHLEVVGYQTSKDGWEKYGLLECGGNYLLRLLFETSPFYDPEKGKKLYEELSEEDPEDLPDSYFITMGEMFIKGTVFPYNYDKAKEMYQVLYDRGFNNAFDKMREAMKRYHRE